MTLEFVTQIGEGFAGSGADAAHINSVLGALGGPVENAWAGALASPSAGHTPFMVVAQPGIAVKPLTLFVNKASIANERHGELTWGAAQAGVARGVIDALDAATIDVALANELLLITAVWVNPAASDEEAVFANNRSATLAALRSGTNGEPTIDRVRAIGDAVRNPYFRTR